MPARQPFTQGPRLTDAPSGNPATQALASLRGYAYQLYASGVAWLDLQDGEELHLEVAQDYAVAAEGSLRGVEVKDTPASNVTVNSGNVRDFLDSFVDLVERNPDRQIYLRFLSTSSVGVEQRLEHRANGEATLLYWRRAAASAHVQPLRNVLAKVALSDRVRAYIDQRDDAALRADFLRRIHWDCGQQPIDGVLQELENGLLRYYVDQFHRPARKEQLAAAVLQRLLTTTIQAGARQLGRSDLLALVVDTANVLAPNPLFEPLVPKVGAEASVARDDSVQELELSGILEPESDLPLPPLLAERSEVTGEVLERVRHTGFAFVTGSTGSGKTTIARLTARRADTGWAVVDLREATPEQTRQRLSQAVGALPTTAWAGIILDDLNEIEEPAVRKSLLRFLSVLRRRDMLCLVTAYRKPSSRALAELGIDETVHLAVPDLTEAEVVTMISAAGGDPATWSSPVFAAGAFGHPQLVQAVIAGLRTRNWPSDELESLRTFGPSSDIEAARHAARNRLVASLADEDRLLLYRLSLLVGRFNRPLALAVGAISPSVPQPGVHLDQLIGPWVEQSAYSEMRVSPLLQNAGNEILTADDAKSVHRAAAEQILGSRTLAIEKTNAGFLHALLSDSEWPLTRLAHSIVATAAVKRRQLSEWITLLRDHTLSRKIFSQRPAISIMLRLAQFLLIAPSGNPEAIRNCWRVLMAELAETEDVSARELLEYMVLAKALFDQDAVAFLPNSVDLMLRLEQLSKSDPERRAALEDRAPGHGVQREQSMLGTLFISYALRLPGVADLQCAFDRLDAATPEQRQSLLGDVFRMPQDFALLVNHAWLEESKREKLDWPAHAESYRRMADQAARWKYRELALRSHVARGIIFDEYLNDPKSALLALDEAAKLLGDDPILDRARAKVHFRHKDHASALQLIRDGAEKMDQNDPVSRTYLLREAAVSAAETGLWSEARQWFAGARDAASRASSESMRLIAIGLRADEALAAYNAGDTRAALTGLDVALDELAPFDPSGSIAAGYRHRVVSHSILWVFGKITGTDVGVGDEPTMMLPGMCSNPDPSDVSDLPQGSPHYVRYLLVQAEIASGVSAGIEVGLRAHLGGRAIPTMELLVRGTRIQTWVQRFDAKRMIAALPSWVDSQIYLDTHHGVLYRQGGPANPVYGEIEPANPGQLATLRAIFTAEDALLSFGILAALKQKPGELAALFEAAPGIPAAYPGRDILKIMASGKSDEADIRAYTALQVANVIRNPDLTPGDLFVATVRFTQWTKKSNFQRILAPALEAWTRARWGYVIGHQRFFLRSPAISVPAIETTLASTETGLRFVGRLIVAAEPAMIVKLPTALREFLRAL